MAISPTKPRASVQQQKVLVLWLLKQHGPYEDDKGHAVAVMYDDYRAYGGNRENRSFATLLASLEEDGCVLRDIPPGTRRTMSIVLVDLKDYADRVAELGDSVPQKIEREPEATVASPAATPLVPVGPSASEVASELLEQVVSILERPQQFEFNQQALREAREQAEAHKRKLVEVEAELVDVRRRLADATRKQLAAEANLAAVMRDKGTAVRHETVKALDRVMRQTPNRKGD